MRSLDFGPFDEPPPTPDKKRDFPLTAGFVQRYGYSGSREPDDSVGDLFSTTPGCRRDLAGWLSSARSSARNEPEDDDDIITRDLTNEELGRRRFRFEVADEFRHLGPRWGICFSVLHKTATDEALQEFVRIGLMRVLRMQWKSDNAFFKCLKELSTIAKKYGEIFSPEWKFFVNLELFGGYKVVRDISAFRDEVRSWTTDGGKFDNRYLPIFRQGVKKFLFPYKPIDAKYRYRLRDWLSDPANWATSGSSTAKKARVKIGNKVKNARAGKWATAAALPLDELVRMASSELPQHSYVMNKRELGKNRPVITGDFEMYLAMAYVSSFLEPGLRGHPNCSLFWTNKQTVAFSAEKPRGGINIPLDQEQFDHGPTLDMIRNANSEIRLLLNHFYGNTDYWADLDACLRHIEYGTEHSTVHLGDESWQQLSGLLSGLRWTALYGSMFNFAEFYTAQELIKMVFPAPPVSSIVAQGDDDQVTVRKEWAAVALVEAYRLMGLKINPRKFFISTSRDEFLRQVYTENKTSGYPARSIPSIIWRNPVSRDPAFGEDRVRQIVKSWRDYIARGGDRGKAMPLLLRDLVGGGLPSKTVAEQVLSTPASCGGLGIVEIPWGTVWKRFSQTVTEPRHQILENQPGLRRVVDLWKAKNVELNPRALATEWSTSVDVGGSGIDVVRQSSVVETEKIRPFFQRPRCSLSGRSYVPVAAPTKRDLPRTGRDVALQEIIKSKEYERIHTHWVSEEFESLSRTIERKCGRGFWLSWISGDLPLNAPSSFNHSENTISVVMTSLHSWCLLRTLSSYAPSMKTLRRWVLTAELSLRKDIRHITENELRGITVSG